MYVCIYLSIHIHTDIHTHTYEYPYEYEWILNYGVSLWNFPWSIAIDCTLYQKILSRS